jgi:adenosine deaminase CECR1
MPKGALLHVHWHLDATVNPEILLKLALQYPVFHVRVQEPLSIFNLSSNLPEFRALPPDYVSNLSSLTEASYPLGSWVPLHKARDSFALGGQEGFDKWVIGALTINPAEAYGTHNSVKKASLSTLRFNLKCLSSLLANRFGKVYKHIHYIYCLLFIFPIHLILLINSRVSFDLSPCFQSISESSSALRLRMVYRMSNREFTSYTSEFTHFLLWETLTNRFARHMYGADGQENVPHREWLVMFDRVINQVKAEMVEMGRPNDFIGAKVCSFFSKKCSLFIKDVDYILYNSMHDTR